MRRSSSSHHHSHRDRDRAEPAHAPINQSYDTSVPIRHHSTRSSHSHRSHRTHDSHHSHDRDSHHSHHSRHTPQPPQPSQYAQDAVRPDAESRYAVNPTPYGDPQAQASGSASRYRDPREHEDRREHSRARTGWQGW